MFHIGSNHEIVIYISCEIIFRVKRNLILIKIITGYRVNDLG